MPPAIEMPLNRFKRLNNSFEFFISSKNDESAINPGSAGIDGFTASIKDFIVAFTNFSISPKYYKC